MAYKILFAGPVGAGKTTAIDCISDIPVIKTEAEATDEVVLRKSTTTVAMDYGVLQLENDIKVHLYGTPGQDRFDFMWDVLSVGALGVVLLIDNARSDPLADLEFYLQAFRRFAGSNALVIGVTRMDKSTHPSLHTFHNWLEERDLKIPLFEIDARDRKDVKTLMLGLLAVLDPGLSR